MVPWGEMHSRERVPHAGTQSAWEGGRRSQSSLLARLARVPALRGGQAGLGLGMASQKGGSWSAQVARVGWAGQKGSSSWFGWQGKGVLGWAARRVAAGQLG